MNITKTKLIRRMLLKTQRVENKVKKHFVLLLILVAVFLGWGMQGIAQPVEPDYSKKVLNSEHWTKQKLENMLNTAPFVFEGRVIGYVPASHTRLSYLFEIEKVYRGEERLQAGTVEIIIGRARGEELEIMDENNPLMHLSAGWHLVFAQEIDISGSFEANNPIKLELCFENFEVPSCFSEEKEIKYISHGVDPMETGLFFYRGPYIDFRTKEEVREFISVYNLYPTDMHRADTLKTLTWKDIEKTKEKAIRDAEEMLKRAGDYKKYYRQLLEMNYHIDTLTGGQATSLREIEDAIEIYENASDSERKTLIYNKQLEYNQKADRILDANAMKKKSNKQQTRGDDDATLITSIQNAIVTEDTYGRYLEFDIMVRADTVDTYPYMIIRALCQLQIANYKLRVTKYLMFWGEISQRHCEARSAEAIQKHPLFWRGRGERSLDCFISFAMTYRICQQECIL